MTGQIWALGAGERAAAVVRALDRAHDATGGAVHHLVRAGDVDWTGPGAAGYRAELASALDGVRLLRTRLAEAETAAAQHAAAVRRWEELALAEGRPVGLLPALGGPWWAR